MTASANMLFEPMPSAYEAGGVRYQADTCFRCGVRVALLIEDPAVDARVKPALVVANVLPGLPPALPLADALEWCLWFHSCGEAARGRGGARRGPRDFSFDDDAGRIVADFQRFYGVDLTDPSTRMHWWRFMALLRNLGEDSATMAAIRLRGMEPTKGMDAKARRDLWAAKRAVELSPRTAEEARAMEDRRWGL